MFISNRTLRAWYRLQQHGARLHVKAVGAGLWSVTFIVEDLAIVGLIRESQLRHVGQRVLLVDVGVDDDE